MFEIMPASEAADLSSKAINNQGQMDLFFLSAIIQKKVAEGLKTFPYTCNSPESATVVKSQLEALGYVVQADAAQLTIVWS